jgi:RNase P/RNase MRP subunit p30
MKNCDLHIRASEPLEDYVSMASRLGLESICLVKVIEGKSTLPEFKEFCKRVRSIKTKIAIYCGVELSPKAQNVQRLVREFRRDADIIIVSGDEALNRAASECWEIDVIESPYLSGDKDFMHQRNSGIDYTIGRNCAERGIAIGFGFRDILNASRKRRLTLLGRMMQNVQICRDTGTPMFVSSSASKPLEMRSANTLISFATILGFEDTELPGASGACAGIIERTLRRKDDAVLLRGFKVLEWGDSKIIKPKKIYGWY